MNMKIGIMGTGGMGGYIGGCLARAGRDVVFIARGKHLEAIQRNGLKIESPAGNFKISSVQATDSPAEAGQVDLILFCVKSYDAVEAARLMQPMIGPRTAIVPVLNGIAHIEALGSLCGTHRVLGGVAEIIANIREPGMIRHLGLNTLLFGEIEGGISDRCEKIQEALKVDGLEAAAVPDIGMQLWRKFAIIAGLAGVFCVMRGSKELIYDFPETRALLAQAIAEVIRLAQKKGYPLDDAYAEGVVSAISNTPPDYKPSMLVDLERGNRIEVHTIHGVVSSYGKALGVPTPVNDFIFACLQPHANGTPSP